jgi:hypothetical protein
MLTTFAFLSGLPSGVLITVIGAGVVALITAAAQGWKPYRETGRFPTKALRAAVALVAVVAIIGAIAALSDKGQNSRSSVYEPPPPTTDTTDTTDTTTAETTPTLPPVPCALSNASHDSSGSSTPYESNDRAATAFGPIVAGRTYAAATESGKDEDYYVFCVDQTTIVHLHAEQVKAGTTDVRITGHDVDEGKTTTTDRPLDLNVTLSKPGRYYVVASNYFLEGNGRYQFRLSANRPLVQELPGDSG